LTDLNGKPKPLIISGHLDDEEEEEEEEEVLFTST
jgi:hypothetical protein